MGMHKNARLTPLGRERLVRLIGSGQTPKAVAEAVGMCPRTVRKWVARYRSEGVAGLEGRSSRPHRLCRPTAPEVFAKIEALRRQRWTGHRITGDHTRQSSARGYKDGKTWGAGARIYRLYRRLRCGL